MDEHRNRRDLMRRGHRLKWRIRRLKEQNAVMYALLGEKVAKEMTLRRTPSQSSDPIEAMVFSARSGKKEKDKGSP